MCNINIDDDDVLLDVIVMERIKCGGDRHGIVVDDGIHCSNMASKFR